MKCEIEWVPVEERLPDSERCVLVSSGGQSSREDSYTRHGTWRAYGGVIAWAELPTYTPPSKPKPVTLYEDDWAVINRLLWEVVVSNPGVKDLMRLAYDDMVIRVRNRNGLDPSKKLN